MCAIQEVFVGKTKESLDVVDSEHVIGDISVLMSSSLLWKLMERYKR